MYRAFPTDEASGHTFLADVAGRREFRAFFRDHHLHGGQQMMRAFVAPETPYSRFLVNWPPGVGKTRFMAAAIRTFLNHAVRAPAGTHHAIILGYGATVNAMLQEILTFPELGFITSEQASNLALLLTAATKTNTQEDRQKYTDARGQITRSLADPQFGRLRMFGYQKFVRRMFATTALGRSKNLTLRQILNARPGDDVISLEQAMEENLIEFAPGALIAKKGLIFVDEFHHLFNSSGLNTFGQGLLTMLESEEFHDLRIVLMTGTVMMSSPSEIISVLNFLHSTARSTRFDRRDFFKDETLLPGALDRIAALMAGRISYAIGIHRGTLAPGEIGGFAKEEWIGESVPDIDFPVVVCPPSPLQNKVLSGFYETDPTRGREWTLPLDRTAVLDFVVEDDKGAPAWGVSGINRILEAPPQWKTKHGVEASEEFTPGLSGPFVAKAIQAGASKISTLIQDIRRELRKSRSDGKGMGKAFIYHEDIACGISLIVESLRNLGVINVGAPPSSDTICSQCGHTKNEHAKMTSHPFTASRYIAVVGSLTQNEKIDAVSRYNMPQNDYGNEIQFIIGSEVMKEGFSLLNVNFTFIVKLPDDVSSLEQVAARTRRKGGHDRLPAHRRIIYYRLYLLGGLKEHPDAAPDIARTIKKFRNHRTIELINDRIRSMAVDRKHEVTDSAGEIVSTFYTYGYARESVATIQRIVINALKTANGIMSWEQLLDAVHKDIINGEGATTESLLRIAIARIAWSPPRTDQNAYIRKVAPILIPRGDSHSIVVAWGTPERPGLALVPAVGGATPMLVSDAAYRSPPERSVIRFSLSNLISNDDRSDYYRQMLQEIISTNGVKAAAAQNFSIEQALFNAILKLPPQFQVDLIRTILGHGPISETIIDEFRRDIDAFRKIYMLAFVIIPRSALSMTIPEKFAYVYLGSVWYWDGQWMSTGSELAVKSETVLTAIITRPENPAVIGFVGTSASRRSPAFKVRPPVYMIRKEADMRETLRGGVCSTRNKADLIRDIISIFATNALTKRDLDGLSSSELCQLLSQRLVELEVEVRSALAAGTPVRYKSVPSCLEATDKVCRWLYLFNETPATL